MAVLKMHKSTIDGLPADLTNLANAISTETTARIQGDLTLQNKIDSESTARLTAVTTINNNLSLQSSAISTLESEMAIVNGGTDVIGSIARVGLDSKSYTDVTAATLTTAYQSYADQVEMDAISTSTNYADTREVAITTAYRSYADQAESDAITAAKSYTDSNVAILNSSISTKLTASNNLSDVTDVAAARINLGIYSAAQVDDAINVAKLSLGTNYSVADSVSKSVLTDLTVSDNVFVTDDGDGKWALYKVIAITDGSGSTSTFEKIMDKDVYLNAISKEAVKSAYELNDDTNAFTDVEKQNVANSVAALDILNANSTTDGSFKKGDADTLSTAKFYTDTREASITTAYQNYADQAKSDAKSYTDTRETAITNAYQSAIATAKAEAITAAAGTTASDIATLSAVVSTKLSKSSNLSDLDNVATARTNLDVYSRSEIDSTVNTVVVSLMKYKSELLIVSNDLITLTHAPIDGSVLGYEFVRYTDELQNSYDIPVTVTATEGGNEFLLHGDSANQFDGKNVRVQYMYI